MNLSLVVFTAMGNWPHNSYVFSWIQRLCFDHEFHGLRNNTNTQSDRMARREHKAYVTLFVQSTTSPPLQQDL